MDSLLEICSKKKKKKKKKKSTIISVGEDVVKRGPLCTVMGM